MSVTSIQSLSNEMSNLPIMIPTGASITQAAVSGMRELLSDVHHAVCCDLENCPQGAKCTNYKNLWLHMKDCNNTFCEFPLCKDSKTVLLHFQNCQNRNQCTVCECLNRSSEQNIALMSSASERSPEERKMECCSPSKEKEIKLHLQLLKHAEKCDGNCGAINCTKMQELMQHKRECGAGNSPRPGQSPLLSPRASASASLLLGDECLLCRRMGNLYKLHRSVCKDKTCSIPLCHEKRRMQVLAGRFETLAVQR